MHAPNVFALTPIGNELPCPPNLVRQGIRKSLRDTKNYRNEILLQVLCANSDPLNAIQ